VKTNVLFFTKTSDPAKGATQAVWIYDLRANMAQFGKRTALTHEHFYDFIKAFGEDKNGQSPCTDLGETGRFRCFSRADIAARDDSLDIAWLKDDSATDAADLPEPEALAQQAMLELEGVFADLKELMEALGVEEVE
jgi:type I restriction enzyme M protein